MRPLVRLLLRYGITAPAFQELARKEFTDVAFDDFPVSGRSQSASRVAVITGLSRKEVARLRALPHLEEADTTWRNRAASVLSSWTIDADFLDRKGDPLDLPFDGASPNFCDLVKAHAGDVTPRAIVDELMRTGALEEAEGKLRMTSRGYVPADDTKALLDILGEDTAELIETIDHNVQTDDDRLLQAKVLAENLPAEHYDEFIRYSKTLARHMLDELTRWLTERDLGDDEGGTDKRYEVGLGLYHISRVKRAGVADTSKEKEQ